MTKQEAQAVTKGDHVHFLGNEYRVESIKTTGIAAPYFRLSPIDVTLPAEDVTSYRLCTRVPTENSP